MTTTDKLLKLGTTDLAGSDLFRIWNQAYGGDAALSLTNLIAYVQANLTLNELTTQYAAPSATGFSVTVADGDTWLILTPGGGYAAGTIVLPSAEDKEEVLVNCTQSVTTLTITPQTGDTVTGAPSSLSANDYFRLRYDGATDVWYRVG
jgi:hypothetical protein